jgi:hypothetical protein
MRTLGQEAAANACEVVARSVFPAGVPGGRAARDAILGRVEWTRFARHENTLHDLGWEKLLEAIARYVDAHRDAFLE